MARHQIIYTSCMRGIDGVNDGQQIFSYDETFTESKSDDVKGLFTYQVPSLPSGTLMSEELAKTMPASFMYRYLRNGNVAITLNTYLGRDYMGSAGRFGNHLSHSIVCDFSDLNIYPCEMYASTALRNSMEYEEVNNPNPPEYLPVPELTRGYVVEPDSIIEFLGIGDNLEIYKKMVAALLKFSVEKKRVVICDDTENKTKWIAALHYALPLDIAKRVNFTTYEYDPELSPAQICGVIAEGSRYNVANYIASNRHYVFDFTNNQFSSIEADDIFLDFLDTAFSFSYDSLTEFQQFVTQKTTYRECSEGYYASYYLYSFLAEGISDISKNQFKEIIKFSGEFLTESTKDEVLAKLIHESENINTLDNEYALSVLGFMLNSINRLDVNQQKELKRMIVNRLILSLSSGDMSETTFVPLYDNLDKMAREVGLSIPAELMVDRNRDSLLAMLGQRVESWKVLFVIRIISDYVKDMSLPIDDLYPNHNIGKIYFGIVRLMYSSGRQKGQEFVEKIISSFAESPNYYVNIVLNIEGFLKDINLQDSDVTHLWDLFYSKTLTMDTKSIDSICSILMEYDRYDEIYQLYDRQIRMKSTFKETRDFFAEYWRRWFTNYSGYGKAYAATALKDYEMLYEHKMNDVSDKDLFRYATEILHLAMRMQIKDDYVIALSQTVCEFIPLEKLDSDNLKTINEIYRYQTETLEKPIEGRLLLIWIAVRFGKITNKRDVKKSAQEIKAVESGHGGARLDNMSDRKIKDYFDWAFETVSSFNLVSDDYMSIYKLFDFSRQTQKLFMEYWCKIAYNKSKGDKDYADFAEFLLFMFSVGSRDDQDMVGKHLCKLNKQKLEELDIEMKNIFKKDRNKTHAWENVREIAASTNPLLNNLSNLFKRK